MYMNIAPHYKDNIGQRGLDTSGLPLSYSSIQENSTIPDFDRKKRATIYWKLNQFFQSSIDTKGRTKSEYWQSRVGSV